MEVRSRAGQACGARHSYTGTGSKGRVGLTCSLGGLALDSFLFRTGQWQVGDKEKSQETDGAAHKE
jgi:hypothetical protein